MLLSINYLRNMIFYRPEWTSGRYDRNTHSAICYNLLTGMSYFFEDISADVLGTILASCRWGCVDTQVICREFNLCGGEIAIFFKQLVEIGLLSNSRLTQEEVYDVRKHISAQRSMGGRQILNPNDKELADAERDYLDRTHSKVYSLLIEMTYNCSEKCIHCYNPGASRNDGEKSGRSRFSELTIADYKRIIDEFYEAGLIRVTLSGGDPFSKPIIWEVIEYLYNKGIVFDIYTNGQRLIGNEDRIAKYYPCTVGISVYSDIPEVHDSITRVSGSYKNTICVLDKLAGLGITIGIKCCLMHQNIRSYRGVAKIADKYSATLQIDCNIFDSVDGDTCASKYLRLSPEEMRIVLRDKDLTSYVGSEVENYGEVVVTDDKNICAAGYASYCLTPDGKLTLCPSFPSVIGDLKMSSFIDVLNSPHLAFWKKAKRSDYKECGQKDYCKFCAPCPGLNFTKNGSPFVPSENNCYLAKMRKEVADMLKAGSDPLDGASSIEEALCRLPMYTNNHIEITKYKSYYAAPLSSIDNSR